MSGKLAAALLFLVTTTSGFAFETSSDSNRNQGVVGGQGRALLDDGSVVGSPFMGNWSRNGHLITVHFLDNVSNGAQNFVKWTLDLREETIKGLYYAIK